MAHVTVSSIGNPEFINLQPVDINPLMSACEIKVLYLGQNRNRSFIDKETAAEMAKSLRGAPIVGYYNEDKGDFRDHGEQITMDADGIHFNCLTKPYGFVAPDAKVWFQKFTEQDEFGNAVEREYLMTTGYLWTGQYEECKLAVEDGGRPHSMELDEDTLKGHWAEDYNKNVEFFIINDAIFSKLCILGEDVEPCFEGSAVTAPDVSKNFTKNKEDFTRTLFSMMQELQTVLKGGTSMENKEFTVEESTEEVTENFSAEEDKVEQNYTEENQESTEAEDNTSFEKKEEDAADEDTDVDDKEDDDDDKKPATKNACSDDDEDKKKDDKYTLLEQQYTELNQKYTEMETAYQELLSFKKVIENEKKDQMINKFFMLSDEDKKDVIDHKDEYSVDDIESKLSIIYANKKMASESNEGKENTKSNSGVVTYEVSGSDASGVPEWIKAVRAIEKEM